MLALIGEAGIAGGAVSDDLEQPSESSKQKPSAIEIRLIDFAIDLSPLMIGMYDSKLLIDQDLRCIQVAPKADLEKHLWYLNRFEIGSR